MKTYDEIAEIKADLINETTNMFNHHELFQILLFGLKDKLEKKQTYCDKWRDSGDRGACYAHEVAPIKELLTKFEEL